MYRTLIIIFVIPYPVFGTSAMYVHIMNNVISFLCKFEDTAWAEIHSSKCKSHNQAQLSKLIPKSQCMDVYIISE